jgi:hypothetical protein
MESFQRKGGKNAKNRKEIREMTKFNVCWQMKTKNEFFAFFAPLR